MSRNDPRRPGESPFSAEYSSTSTSDEPFFVEIVKEPEPPVPPPSPPREVEEPPHWFRGSANQEPASPASKLSPPPANGKSRLNPRRPKPPLVSAEEESEEELPWPEKFKRWILGEGGAGYGISVVVHIVLLLGMSLWMFTTPQQEELVTTFEQTEVADIAAIRDVQIEELENDFEPQMDNPLVDAAPLSAPDIGIGMPSSLLESIGGGVDIQIPSQAVTKGSFTVWTEPEDPMPGQQYKIMIQVKLNNIELKRYPRRDLSGSIVGTDGYRDFFGGPTEPGYLPVKDNSVHYEALIVPGAAELVKDIINVESKILKEKQQIELVF